MRQRLQVRHARYDLESHVDRHVLVLSRKRSCLISYPRYLWDKVFARLADG